MTKQRSDFNYLYPICLDCIDLLNGSTKKCADCVIHLLMQLAKKEGVSE